MALKNKPKVIGIIQARMSSERLYGKVLLPVLGRPILKLLSERILTKKVDEFWLATSVEIEDDLIASWGVSLGLRVYRGDLNDVLSRFVGIIEMSNADIIVRLTADNPTVNDVLIENSLNQFESQELDYLSPSPELPIGFGIEVVRADIVKKLTSLIPQDQKYHFVHVLSYLTMLDEYKKGAFTKPRSWPTCNARWTLDTLEDYKYIKLLFNIAHDTKANFSALSKVANANSTLQEINSHVRQKQMEEG